MFWPKNIIISQTPPTTVTMVVRPQTRDLSAGPSLGKQGIYDVGSPHASGNTVA